MIILHIAHIDSEILGGVQIAVPKMVKAQASYANVALLNVKGIALPNVKTLKLEKDFSFSQMPKPYNCPDLVIFHEIYRFPYIKMYNELLKREIPYIVIPHGGLSAQAQKRKILKKSIANLLFFNRYIRKAKAIQYLSDNECSMSIEKKHLSIVLGNGIELPKSTKKYFNKKGIMFVYIGRLEIETKGLDLLIDAMNICQNELRKLGARIAIYGPNYGGEHKILQDMAEKKQVADLISIGNEKIGAEKEKILLEADWFIQPSRTEGLPLGPLEALSYGLPCIVTAGTGLKEIVENNHAGYGCQTTAKEIAKTIEKAIRSVDQMQDFSEAAKVLVKKSFESGCVAKKTINKYSEIVNEQYNEK